MSTRRRKRHRPGDGLERERGAGAAAGRHRPVLWWIGVGLVLAAGGAIFYGVATRHGLLRGTGHPRNVLLITVDTTRADYLRCYGHPTVPTPHMDRLAEEGALFRRCAASSVQTLPSHATIMTGLYPFVHGVRRNGTDQLPAGTVTLAETLKSAGFATAAAVASYVLDPTFGIAQGFDAYRTVPPPRPGGDSVSAQRKGDAVADDALDLLRGLAGKRFFLWVHFYDPHYPYESARVPDPASPLAYEDEVAFMDVQIGRVLEGLRALKLEQETLVVLVGDHGEGLGDHDEFQHGFFIYETGLHVPLILRCPGAVPAGRQVDAVVRTLDVAPTILELLGRPALADAQGVSLTPLLSGAADDLGLAAYGEAPEPHTLFRLSRLRSLTVGDWKYIHSSAPRLYDVRSDPGELHDLIDARAELAAQMRAQLRDLIAEAPPVVAGETRVVLAGSELARLESLGYLGVVSDPNEEGLSELDLFEPTGPDPHQYAAVLGVYEHARHAIGHGRFGAAEVQLREVLTALPEAPAVLRDLAHALARQGKTDEAAQTYERAIVVVPTDTHTRLQYASMLMDAQRWEPAIAQAGQVLTQLPEEPTAHAMLGVAYAALNRLDEAAAHLEAAVRGDPRGLEALHALGQVYYRQRRLPEAAECFRKVLAIEPRWERARAALQAIEREMQR